jgi:hypothetical protein
MLKMKKIKWIGVLVILMGFSVSVLAQQVIDRPQLFKRESPYERYTTYRVSVTGGLGLPVGTFSDYMDKTTLRNYTLGLDFVFPKNNLSLGVSVGSQYFQNRLPRQVYNFDGQDVSAVQTRTFAAYWGTIPTGDNGFRFVAQAGAGVRVLFKKTGNVGLELGVNYQHIPFIVESEGVKDASTFNVRAGLFYRWW